jgi:pimeloyl-ACP methyl ester carboxylesterase
MTSNGWMKRVLGLVFVGLVMAGCLAEATDEDEGNSPIGESRAATLANRTRLPIVLLHGAAGFAQIGPLDYYFGVKRRLVSDGYQVFATEVDPFQRIEVRAAQLQQQIGAILTATGAPRVHLIAHSQGGLDARYLISSLGFGHRVATLTTISTPHRGPAVDTLAFLLNLIGGGGQDPQGQAYQLTEEYAVNVFEPNTPDDPRVSYYSVAGVTRAVVFNVFRDDLCDPLLWAGYLLLSPTGANDGLVTVQSARHGTYLGQVPADHFDEVGQLLGTTALGFNHRTFYSRLARFVTDPSAPSPVQ